MNSATERVWSNLRRMWDKGHTFDHKPGEDNPFRATRRRDDREFAAKSPESLRSLIRTSARRF